MRTTRSQQQNANESQNYAKSRWPRKKPAANADLSEGKTREKRLRIRWQSVAFKTATRAFLVGRVAPTFFLAFVAAASSHPALTTW